MESKASDSILNPKVLEVAQPIYDSIDFNNLEEFDFDGATYVFEGVGYKVNQDHTEFIFKVTAPNGISF